MSFTLTSTTATTNPADIERKWYVVDATNQPLGRISSKIASILRGKHTPRYSTNVDTGDFVVVINAEKVKLTGNKLETKFWYKHSAIPGGFRAEQYGKLMDRKPEFAIEKAVHGMMPKNPLGRQMESKLKVYKGATHPHAAQKPEVLAV